MTLPALYQLKRVDDAGLGRRDGAKGSRMTRLVVSGQVGQAFPGLLISAIVTAGFDGHPPWPELDERFAALEAAARPVPGADDDPHIAAWHAAYRAFGTNPRRQRPSAEALLRRLARSGRLPRINPADRDQGIWDRQADRDQGIRSSARRMLTIRVPTGLYPWAAGASRYGT